MKLMLKNQEAKLRKNSEIATIDPEGDHDFVPVIKLFTPDANATWLLTELDQSNEFFGLCDLGHGTPELGYVPMKSIMELRGQLGLPVERDRHFKANKPISEYADEARAKGRIVA